VDPESQISTSVSAGRGMVSDMANRGGKGESAPMTLSQALAAHMSASTVAAHARRDVLATLRCLRAFSDSKAYVANHQ
jgi:hypothetical protein